MRTESNLLGGKTLVLENAEELRQLREPWAKLVTPRVARAFARFPGSLLDLGSALRRRPIRRALEVLVETGRCELEINRPGARGGGPPEVYLRVGAQPVLFSLSVGRVPARAPAALREVLQSVGVVRSQYGGALGLLRPTEQRSLADVASQYDGLYPGTLASLPMPRDPSSFHSFFEDSGAYLFANPSGRTWKFSLTPGEFGAGPSMGAWLDRFFEAGPFGPSWPTGN